MIALREEAQTLFIVVQTVESGMPALMAHWRAGFWPRLENLLYGVLAQEARIIGVLCRENIAEVNFIDLSRLDIGDSVQGSCEGLAWLSVCSKCERYYI